MTISLTTALTILGSFGAASTAQIVSHILTQKREDLKYKKECLQNLYSPNIFKVIDYIRLQGRNYSPLYDKFGSTEALFQEILKDIGKNLKFADADLINIYEENRYIEIEIDINTESDLDDEYEELLNDHELTQRITLANLFFSQYLEINKALKSHSNSITEKLIPPYFFSHFYLLVKECSYYGFSSADILELYDLIETTLIPTNNYIERIVEIRNELDNVMNTPAYKNRKRVTEAYASAYQFLYEFVDEFSYLSDARAANWKELLENNLSINFYQS